MAAVQEDDDDDSEEDALGAIAEAISQIHPGEITELKALHKPPQPLVDVLVPFGNFYRINGNSNHDWVSVKKFLGDSGLPVITVP